MDFARPKRGLATAASGDAVFESLSSDKVNAVVAATDAVGAFDGYDLSKNARLIQMSAEKFIELHDYLQMDWLPYIVLVSALSRLVFFPLQMYSLRTSDGLIKVQSELKATGVNPMTPEGAATMKSLYAKHNFSYTRMLWPIFLVQMPIGSLLYMGFFAVMKSGHPSLSDAGALWFTDLGASDPYYLLPMAVGTGTAGMMMFNFYMANPATKPKDEMSKNVQKFMGGFITLLMTGMTIHAGNGMGVFFLSQIPLHMGYSFLISRPWLRNALGVTPYGVPYYVGPTEAVAAATETPLVTNVVPSVTAMYAKSSASNPATMSAKPVVDPLEREGVFTGSQPVGSTSLDVKSRREARKRRAQQE